MNTNISNDELTADRIEQLRQTDPTSVSLTEQIEEFERVYGRPAETQPKSVTTFNTINAQMNT